MRLTFLLGKNRIQRIANAFGELVLHAIFLVVCSLLQLCEYQTYRQECVWNTWKFFFFFSSFKSHNKCHVKLSESIWMALNNNEMNQKKEKWNEKKVSFGFNSRWQTSSKQCRHQNLVRIHFYDMKNVVHHPKKKKEKTNMYVAISVFYSLVIKFATFSKVEN